MINVPVDDKEAEVDNNDDDQEEKDAEDEVAFDDVDDKKQHGLSRSVWIETTKLWAVAGPVLFGKIAAYSMNVMTQAFAGHLGEVELAAISIANTVIVGFNFGLLLGMASALQTLCGQAFGAKKYHMLGVYLQRSCIVLFLCCFLLLPIYVFTSPILKLLGQPHDVAEKSGIVAIWLLPLHFNFALSFPLQVFLQCQLKTQIIAWVSLIALGINALGSWIFIYVFDWGIIGAAIILDISWWLMNLAMFAYVWFRCPLTWTGFSMEAFSGLWEFIKLSASSGVMLCLENWYFRILVLMTGFMKNATLAIDALSVCMSISGWEMMVPLAFFAAAAVRVANELGAGNGKAARFATRVSIFQSTIIGLIICIFIVLLLDKISLIFTSSHDVIKEAKNLSILLGATILLNSIQLVLSGVAVGSGWQAYVAYINLGCYYIVGLPLGIIMECVFKLGVKGIWGAMIVGGTFLQTLILAVIVLRTNWEKEAGIACDRIASWSTSNQKEESQDKHLQQP